MSRAASGRPGRPGQTPIASAAARPAEKALVALAQMRARTREDAEQGFVAVLRAAAEAKGALERAEADRAANAARARATLADARKNARYGHELGAVDALTRAVRDDAARDSRVVAAAEAAHAQAERGAAIAKQALASAQADEDAVLGRLAAAAAQARAQAFAREDDEADERAGRASHGKNASR